MTTRLLASVMAGVLVLVTAGPGWAEKSAGSLENKRKGEAAGPPDTALVMEKLQEEIRELNRRLDERERTIRTLTDSLTISQTESEIMHREWEALKLKQEIGALNAGQVELETRLVETLRSLYTSERERQKLAERLEQLTQRLNKLLKSAEFEDPKARADLEVEIRTTRRLLDDMTGQNLAGNRTSADLSNASVINVNTNLALVIINMGRQQGVRRGMPFVILRDDKLVGEVKVVDVRDEISGAVIARTERKEKILAGDRAKVAVKK